MDSKYKIGQVFMEDEFPDYTYEIVAISPKLDYEGDYSYFVEIKDRSGAISYDVRYQSDMDRWAKEIR